MAEEYFKAPSTFSMEPRKKKNNKLMWLGLLFMMIGIGGFIGWRLIAPSSYSVEKTDVSPTPTDVMFPTDTPTPLPTETPTPKVTVTPKQINSIDKQTGLDRSKLSITIQNGGGQVGAASKMSATLKEFGYNVVSLGNADAYTYESTVIQVKSEKSAYLPLLKKDLSGAYTIGSASATLSASASADAVVIVGKQ